MGDCHSYSDYSPATRVRVSTEHYVVVNALVCRYD